MGCCLPELLPIYLEMQLSMVGIAAAESAFQTLPSPNFVSRQKFPQDNLQAALSTAENTKERKKLPRTTAVFYKAFEGKGGDGPKKCGDH